ncbi:type III-A CRISPR-associated protein Cas10/Csm1 [Neolewinella aurantiaca]|uniref:CRISPR system single-strand-specific deoxyribonuclease Cas10/Csm1 (subtype III-A) n=1 Tax=Neolewinella aurantiaca TaxID=2602767 RepID=A0A5C7FEQ6_9BACT|nr:type III-A CRISPR-associated protein Cas10/Csm1 [Neolewinella aurantiaca]TXF87991.1 type III-A CRISPR-associated protein Cas10/Csm1 [Neolewinella aurantiaca]
MPTTTSTEKQQLILAALLHGIGKFWQRSDSPLFEGSAIKNLDETHLRSFAPVDHNGIPAFQHVLWTYQFLEDFSDKFKKLRLWETSLGKLSELAARYNLPSTEPEKMLQLASTWCSGNESVEAELSVPNGSTESKRLLLQSIFSRAKISGQKATDRTLPVRSLSIEGTKPFLINEEFTASEVEKVHKSYRKLWSDFRDDFARIPTESAEDFLFTLQQVLRKYCSCIPMNTGKVRTINLYEHLKTTAALVTCLHDFSTEKQINTASIKEHDHLLIKMICLDLSGIQSFIYDISSSKAYKSLKGRSFFLTALIEQMTTVLLRETNQHYPNILYASGGKAYYLLPNTEAVTKGLARARHLIEDQAYYEEGGSIFPAMGEVVFGFRGTQVVSDDGLESLGALWKAVSDRASQQKNRRYERILQSSFEDIFSEKGEPALLSGSTDQLCAVTGVPIPKGKGNRLNEGDKDSPLITQRVNDHISAGKKLKNANYLLYANQASHDLSFSKLDRVLGLRAESGEARSGEQRLRLNSTNFLPPAAQQGGYGFCFYGGNSQPDARGRKEVAEFEDLCWYKDSKSGDPQYALLGVLRMDVDSLGQLFIKGFADKDKSFAAYATLSAQLDFFFSGYINIIREEADFKNQVSIVYSGGDDVFALGRWDRIIDFGKRIREEFRDFVGRDDLTISAGISIVNHKYPIYRAAEMAGDEEDRAKSHRFKAKNSDEQPKNALAIFGIALNWDEEFPAVEKLKTELLEHEANGLNRAILHTIQEAYVQSLPDPKTNAVDFSYKWRTAYTLKRMADRYNKNQKAIGDFIEKLNQELLHNDAFGADHYLKLAAVASRWAELELKLKTTANA